MAVPVLSYGRELPTATKKQESKIEDSEIASLSGVKRYSKLDRIKNEAIREELKVFN